MAFAFEREYRLCKEWQVLKSHFQFEIWTNEIIKFFSDKCKLNPFSHSVYMNWATSDSQRTVIPTSKQQVVTLNKKWSNCFPQIYQGCLPTKQLFWGFFFSLHPPPLFFPFSLYKILRQNIENYRHDVDSRKIFSAFFRWFFFNRKFGISAYLS